MRDNLCKENNLKLVIMCNKQLIDKSEKEIQLCEEDKKNDIQRYPGSNDEIILNKKGLIFKRLEEIIRAEYSLGTKCSNMEQWLSKIIKKGTRNKL